MRRYDMHIHLDGFIDEEGCILDKMQECGIYGGCIISPEPKEFSAEKGMDFDDRLEKVLSYTDNYRDRLFPILWIHPDEGDLFAKIDKAVEKGIDGFKIICNNFYVYEERCIKILKYIASKDKPVIFHSGILWDGTDSSKYNRPLNWESLIRIKGLRFSMGHCSWPWYDECVALYGKFLNGMTTGETAEMFLDITPGTPEIYREDLFKKLYFCGYDVGDHVMFGCDCTAELYRPEWTGKWLDIDRKIMDRFCVGKIYREKLYYNNLMRFLGRDKSKLEIKSPVPDCANLWTPSEEDTKPIIEKWYRKLSFPEKYDSEFYSALSSIKIHDFDNIEDYDVNCDDGKKNLLSFLYFCENTANKYKDLGIDESVLIETLSDLVIWTEVWSELKGELYLGELSWLKRHLSSRLFKLGRLQFCMAEYEEEVFNRGPKRHEKVIEVHIPAVGPLHMEDCRFSLHRAHHFFEKYFPDYHYEFFTCESWLLGKEINDVLTDNSNIKKFSSMFHIIGQIPSESLFKYLFRWDANRFNIAQYEAKSRLCMIVKELAKSDIVFHNGIGFITRNEFK